MASTLWAKGYTLDPTIARFEAARNAALDAQLALYDIWGSLAHARMLRAVGLLDVREWRALHAGLRSLLLSAERGELTPTADEEDVHTAIENRLVEQIGEVGKKLHTGRSRNDQVLVDLRLYLKKALPRVADVVLDASDTLLRRAGEEEWTPMPGYTHMQRGMLSTAGLWAEAHAEALLDDLMALEAAYQLSDQSPLGSAAAYGVPLPLDRAYAAQLLGFAHVHHNVLTAANSRGKVEAAAVQALALILLDLSKWAQDVLLFTTTEYGFLAAPDELCDGSSIMPQKHNLSALELVRARAHTIIALQGQMLSTLAGLPSGYNMDYQETKAPLLEAVAIVLESLEVTQLFAAGLIFDRERMKTACTPELFATDRAYALTVQGVPFRDAYRKVAEDASEAGLNAATDSIGVPGDGTLQDRVRERAAEGAPGNLGLQEVAKRIAHQRCTWGEREAALARAIEALIEDETDPVARRAVKRAAGEWTHAGGFDESRALVLGI
jgi:argininosuccinate lyase